MVDEAPVGRRLRVDQVAGEQHLQRALAPHVARDLDHRRRAEEADAHARGGEARVVGGDGEIAGRHELAAGGGRDAVHLGDNGLRQAVDRHHQLAAGVEELARGRQ